MRHKQSITLSELPKVLSIHLNGSHAAVKILCAEVSVYCIKEVVKHS